MYFFTLCWFSPELKFSSALRKHSGLQRCYGNTDLFNASLPLVHLPPSVCYPVASHCCFPEKQPQFSKWVSKDQPSVSRTVLLSVLFAFMIVFLTVLLSRSPVIPSLWIGSIHDLFCHLQSFLYLTGKCVKRLSSFQSVSPLIKQGPPNSTYF